MLPKIKLASLLCVFAFPLWSNCEFIKIGPCVFGVNETCPDPHIDFYLFTKKNAKIPQKVLPTKESILNSTFEPRNKNKIIIHGYNSDMYLTPLMEIKDAYMETSDYNIWFVDWSFIAAGPCYPVVVWNLNYVGKCIAQLVNEILEVTAVSSEKAFHVIGFSLGAQLAAFTANNVRPYKFSRITGLDPALPLFVTATNDHKLDSSDAKFVDALHTDALKEGKAERCGHIDFYMNGGIEQPGCTGNNLFDLIRCYHLRAPAYFAESITTTVGFYGWPCRGFFYYIINRCPPRRPTVLMGEYVDQTNTGAYIIHTAASKPFALGKNSTFDVPPPKRRYFNENRIVKMYYTILLNYKNNTDNSIDNEIAKMDALIEKLGLIYYKRNLTGI